MYIYITNPLPKEDAVRFGTDLLENEFKNSDCLYVCSNGNGTYSIARRLLLKEIKSVLNTTDIDEMHEYNVQHRDIMDKLENPFGQLVRRFSSPRDLQQLLA